MSQSVRHHWIFRAVVATAVSAMALTAAACGSDSVASPSSDTSAPAAAATDTSSDQASTTTEESEAPAPQDGADSDEKATLTVYSGQHEDFAQQLADGFTAATGIKVTLRAGDDAELANQIVEEGDGSPADVFISEEPGPVAMLDSKGLTSTVNAEALGEVDSRLLPLTNGWLPYAARSRVMFYNPSLIAEEDLPASILDLTDPKWKDMFAYAPSGAFVGTVSYLIDAIGADETLAWLEGIKENGINEQKNGKVRDSVEAGQHPFGLSNHYYWYILAGQEGGADNLASKVHFLDHEDAGGLLLTSGAAVIKASAHQDEAQEFVTWLGSVDGGQQVVAAGDTAQIPVAPGVSSASDIPPLADLHFPQVDPAVYADTAAARDLVIKAGIA